jgi:glycosyltransferase involved in cell wall biosynthesis
VRRGYAVHVRVNGESRKGYALALIALSLARFWRRPALLTYCGGHQQSYFPAPKGSLRHLAFALLFRFATRIYCNSEPVKTALLTAGIDPGRVNPIPHFSKHYIQFEPVAPPPKVEQFCRDRNGFFFVYVCFRKEYTLDFLANVMRSFHTSFPKIGFLLVGTSVRELPSLKEFLGREQLEEMAYAVGAVSHPLFLTLLQRSLAYIRLPLTDGVCASVMEALTLRVPVLASDNGTRPEAGELWNAGEGDRLLELMTRAATAREALVARIPPVMLEDNVARLADDIEQVCALFRDACLVPGSEVASSTRVGS